MFTILQLIIELIPPKIKEPCKRYYTDPVIQKIKPTTVF